MHIAKKALLRAGLGQRYYDFWWRYRCPFDPLPRDQIARGVYFVHIPKTAGTSILSALGVTPTPYTHCPAHVIRERNPIEARGMHFFSVVRDPYARFASSFAYITSRSDWPAQRQFAQDVIGDMGFREFTRKMARNASYRRLITGYEFFFPQSYFTHRGGQSLVPDILRFESLTRDFDRVIRARFANVGGLPVLRRHGPECYDEMYDAASQTLVQQIYAQDFERFGYEM